MKSFPTNRDRIPKPKQFSVFQVGQQFFGEARTRILLSYLLILGVTFVVAIPAFRYIVYQQVDARVRRDMNEDIESFKALMEGKVTFAPIQLEDNDSQTAENFKKQLIEAPGFKSPSSKDDPSDSLKLYLSHRLPEDDSFFLTFVDGEFYKSSPTARPKPLQNDAELMRRWAKQTQPEQGEREFPDDTIGKLLYQVEPIKINGQMRGVFVVAHTTAGERTEALEAITAIIEVIGMVFIVSLIIAWITTGRVLLPLRTLTATAHTISETDLTQRLPVRGKGELANLAQTFNEMMGRLQTAFASQKDFFNDAGHELRTPITIIQGHLELMGDDPDEQQETLAVVMSELDRMSRLVDDMILLAKAERSDFLQLETVDVASLTEELYAKAKMLADRDWQLDAIAQGQIVVDHQRLTEALMNLAQNATKHTGQEDTIAIGSAVAKGKARFWVRDTGEGIPLTDQKRIFERFVRASNSRYRSEGAGLGLSIVQAIAEAHGGRVLLRSQLGTGSMFTIIFPVEPHQKLSNDVQLDAQS
ncbi:MAG TPA: two-component sensor histidine kinase [Cyanobacteria bacterium UBA8543]|nr:two-component sensor histidine kinase [Cyanobacteria bacterium UBA8543]